MGARLVRGLYDPRNEHDACGVGFVAHLKSENSSCWKTSRLAARSVPTR